MVAEPIRILIVDDHAVVRTGLIAFLGSEPSFEVVGEAAGGIQALDTLVHLDAEGRRPHVVLMDLKMEPVDGVETTQRIRAAYDDVAVVALTSFGDQHRVRAALDSGASGYLLKDADADEVAAAVRAASRGELQLDAAITRPLVEPAAGLTPRELDVVQLVAAGRANKEIAAQLAISERTTRTHVSKVLSKLGLTSRTQVALWAVSNDIAVGGNPTDDRRAGAW